MTKPVDFKPDVWTEAAREEFNRWIARIRADAWDEGAKSKQCRCEAWSDGECACGNFPSDPNPYRQASTDREKSGSTDSETP